MPEQNEAQENVEVLSTADNADFLFIKCLNVQRGFQKSYLHLLFQHAFQTLHSALRVHMRPARHVSTSLLYFSLT